MRTIFTQSWEDHDSVDHCVLASFDGCSDLVDDGKRRRITRVDLGPNAVAAVCLVQMAVRLEVDEEFRVLCGQ